MQLVEPCCGALIDQLYQEFREKFVLQYLKDFAEDPTNPEFHIFRQALLESLMDAKHRTDEVRAEVSSAITELKST